MDKLSNMNDGPDKVEHHHEPEPQDAAAVYGTHAPGHDDAIRLPF